MTNQRGAMNTIVIDEVMQDVIEAIQKSFKERMALGIVRQWDEGETIESILKDCVNSIVEIASEMDMDIE